mgnify:CR=1 FL=1
MNLRSESLRRGVLALLAGLLGASATLALARPGAEPAATTAGEPLACVVFDAQAPSRLKLSADQIVEWQRLEQQHGQLFGERCKGDAYAEAMPTRLGDSGGIRAMQVYRKDFLDFLSGLSAEQRNVLEEFARARRDGRAALEEKLIRHRLML